MLSLQVCGGGAPECDGASTAAGVTRGAAVMVGRRDNICAYSIYWVMWGLLGEQLSISIQGGACCHLR